MRALWIVLLVAACGSQDDAEAQTDGPADTGSTSQDPTGGEDPMASSEDSGFPGGRVPWRDEWRTVVDQPFWSAGVQKLTIGGLAEQDNFANRGDVIVRYGDVDRITVEMRKFTIAEGLDAAEQDFASLQLWTTWTNRTPKPPHEMNPVESCVDPSSLAPWPDDCKLRVYFEGPLQPAVTGADLRVTVPSDFTGELVIVTEDSDVHANYHNRGNVCVENLQGLANIEVDSGVAYLILAPDLKLMPGCPDVDYEQCEKFGWDVGLCPCFHGNNPYPFGSSRIRSREGGAADMTIDIPIDFWAAVSLVNLAEHQEADPDTNKCPEDPGACCNATVQASVGHYELDPSIGGPNNRDPWFNAGWTNYPGFPALGGGGYFLQLLSDDCAPITAAENPGDPMQEVERGNLTLCTACLRTQTCDDLLP